MTFRDYRKTYEEMEETKQYEIQSINCFKEK